MTMLPTLLRTQPLEGLFAPTDISATKAVKPDSGTSFSDALRKASSDRTSRERHEISDSRPKSTISDYEPKVGQGDDASGTSPVDSDSGTQSTSTDDHQVSGSDATQDTSTTRDESDVDATSQAQDTSANAQDVPTQTTPQSEIAIGIIDGQGSANKDSSNQPFNALTQSQIGNGMLALEEASESTGQASTSTAINQAIENNGQITDSSLESIDEAMRRAKQASEGSLDSTRQSEAAASSPQANGVRQPIHNDANPNLNEESLSEEKPLNTISVGEHLNEGGQQKENADSKDGQGATRLDDFSGASKINPAESRALQLDSALKLEQMTGQAVAIDTSSKGVDARTNSGMTTGMINTEADLLGSMKLNAEGVDEGRFNSRILRGLTSMLNQRGGVMNMRLDPAELGELKIQMSLANGVVNAQFEASNPQAQEMLNRHLANLRHALEAQGLTVERLHVQTTSSAQSQAAPEDSNGDQSSDEHGSGREGSQDETPTNDRDRAFANLIEDGEQLESDMRSVSPKGARTA